MSRAPGRQAHRLRGAADTRQTQPHVHVVVEKPVAPAGLPDRRQRLRDRRHQQRVRGENGRDVVRPATPRDRQAERLLRVVHPAATAAGHVSAAGHDDHTFRDRAVPVRRAVRVKFGQVPRAGVLRKGRPRGRAVAADDGRITAATTVRGRAQGRRLR